jgi:hypothetical protein
MKILSLGQTLGYSQKLQQYVQCFAGLNLETEKMLRLLGCEADLPTGLVFDAEVVQDKKDDRPESFVLRSAPEKIGTESKEQILDRLEGIVFDSFEDAMESGNSLTAVRVRSFDYVFHRDFKSNLDMIDSCGDRLCLRYLASDAKPKSLPRSWHCKGDEAIVVIGNKKVNRDWIAVRIFHEEFAEPFDPREYQRELMKARRAK